MIFGEQVKFGAFYRLVPTCWYEYMPVQDLRGWSSLPVGYGK